MISIKKFSLKFPQITLFENLSIDFEPSYIYGIFGLNATGKTSFFKAIYGMLKHNGSVDFNNKRIEKNNISFLETENYFYPGLTGRQYLEIFENEYPDIFDVFLLAVLLGLPLDELMDTYSTGMKKKICFLGIIKTNRDIFFLDEPFNGVDVESVEIMGSIIRELKKKSKTIFITTHIPNHIVALCDYVFIIDNTTNFQLRDMNEFNSYLSGLTALIDKKVEKSVLKP